MTYIRSVDDLIRKGEEISVQATDRKRIHAWQVLRVRVDGEARLYFAPRRASSAIFPPGCQLKKLAMSALRMRQPGML